MQPDTLIPDPSNPQAWNRYSYVTNRPINFNDPTGHRGECGVYVGECKSDSYYAGFYTSRLRDKDREKVHRLMDPKHYLEAAVPGLMVYGTYVFGTEAAVRTARSVGATLKAGFWNAARVCIGSAVCRAVTGMAGGAGTGRVVLSGHGGYNPTNGTTTVPAGTRFHTYAPLGKTITDKLGNEIEAGIVNSGKYIFSPGTKIPNLTLYPPTGLNIMGNPTTVNSPTLLSNLLTSNMGDVHWAACLVLEEC